jgi:hypothetical protein
VETFKSDDHIFCSWEMRAFPKEQFARDPEYGLVHTHPPDDAPRHTTSGQILPNEAGAEEYWAIPSTEAARSV